MKRIVTLTESDLTRIIRRVLNEGSGGTPKLNAKGQYIFASGTEAVYKNHNDEKNEWIIDNMCYGLESGNLIRCQNTNGFSLDIVCHGTGNYAIDSDGESLHFVSPTKDFAKKMRSMFCCGKKLKPDNLRAGSKAWENTNCDVLKKIESNKKKFESNIVNTYSLNNGVFYLNNKNFVSYQTHGKDGEKGYMGGNVNSNDHGKCTKISKKNVIRCEFNAYSEYFDISCADVKNYAVNSGGKSIFFTKPKDFAQQMRKLFCSSTNKSKTIKMNPSEKEKCYLADDKTWSYATKNKRWYASKDGKNWFDITNNSKAVKILTDPVNGCKNLKEITSFVPPPEVEFGSPDIPLPN